MKQIISAFCTLLVLVMNILICIGVSVTSGQVAEAKEFKADVIAEIENSNFNPNVIEGCITQAAAAGYDLKVTDCLYDEDNNAQIAEVILSYQYDIPVFGLKETKTTRGIAR